MSDWGRELWAQVISAEQPLIVDADALNWLAQNHQRRDDWILTPHPGEAARLLGSSSAEIQMNRPSSIARLQEEFGGVIALKGAGTLVRGKRLAVCAHGNPGMAVGGMGDVLTGVIAAFVAQGLSLPEAARQGVYVHAAAGDLAARQGERGLMAHDLMEPLRHLVNV